MPSIKKPLLLGESVRGGGGWLLEIQGGKRNFSQGEDSRAFLEKNGGKWGGPGAPFSYPTEERSRKEVFLSSLWGEKNERRKGRSKRGVAQIARKEIVSTQEEKSRLSRKGELREKH